MLAHEHALGRQTGNWKLETGNWKLETQTASAIEVSASLN
jgi:hypothetical protein